MKMSQAGIALLKRFEGCRLTAYNDGVGVSTIGYGTTSMTGVGKISYGMKITQAQADEWLVVGLAKYEKTVSDALKVPATQAQFDAMVSLCYNIGQGAFLRSSVLRGHNAGDITKAAASFGLWNKAGGKVLKGLKMRRKAEADLYLSKPEIKPVQHVPAPMAPIPPKPIEPPVALPEAPQTVWGKLVSWWRS